MVKKQKILYLITKSNWGGAQKYVFDLATSKDIQDKYETLVMCGGDGELIDKLKTNGIQVIPLANLSRDVSLFKDIKGFIDIYKNIKNINPDILHLNSAKASGIGALIGRMLGIKKIVFTAHGWAFNENRNLFSKLIIRLLSYLTVAMSHETIAVSEHIIKSLMPIKIMSPDFIKNKMTVIYNGTHDFEYKDLPKLSSGSNTRHLVSIGELHPSKNHESVIRIIKHIKNIHYHIIGEGTLRPKLEKVILEEKVESNVTLHGHVKSAHLILPQFDLFILPSRTEALGYVAIEALKARLPVVARRVGGIPEVLLNSKNAILFNKDSELIEIINKHNYLGETDWQDERFQIDTMVLNTLQIYDK